MKRILERILRPNDVLVFAFVCGSFYLATYFAQNVDFSVYLDKIIKVEKQRPGVSRSFGSEGRPENLERKILR